MRKHRAYMETAWGDVHYWVAGSGVPLLLLHQAAQSSQECELVAEQLLDDFQVFSFDYPGHGHSTDPKVLLGVNEFSQIAMQLLDLLEIDQAHVAGHHSGGIIAGNLAANEPLHFLSVTMSGVGIRTKSSVDTLLSRPMTRDLPVDRAGDFLLQTWATYRRMSSPETDLATTAEFFLEGFAARRRPFDVHGPVLQFDREPLFATISIPTLLIVGEYDDFVEYPEQLQQTIDGSQLCTIKGGGAFLFYEKPQECATAIREFIQTL